jgi:acyl carrier protein
MDEKIKAVMAKAFDVPIEHITDDSDQDTIENWDSLHHMKMIVFLEREFNITIPDDMVGNMISYKLINSVIIDCYETRI